MDLIKLGLRFLFVGFSFVVMMLLLRTGCKVFVHGVDIPKPSFEIPKTQWQIEQEEREKTKIDSIERADKRKEDSLRNTINIRRFMGNPDSLNTIFENTTYEEQLELKKEYVEREKKIRWKKESKNAKEKEARKKEIQEFADMILSLNIEHQKIQIKADKKYFTIWMGEGEFTLDNKDYDAIRLSFPKDKVTLFDDDYWNKLLLKCNTDCIQVVTRDDDKDATKKYSISDTRVPHKDIERLKYLYQQIKKISDTHDLEALAQMGT